MWKKIFLLLLIILVCGCTEEASRETYGLPDSTFEQLPDMPSDFQDMDKGIYNKDLGVMELAASYYKQPEILPTWESQGVERMKNPFPNRIGIMGFGAYPSLIETSSEKTAFLLHTSWMVQTHQGLGLKAVGDCQLTIEPSNILLEPSYPQFGKNWIQKIAVRIDKKEDCQAQIILTMPSKELSEKWSQLPGYREVGNSGLESLFLLDFKK